jgi:hypothetical protein
MPNRIRHALNATTLLATITLTFTLVFVTVTGAYAANAPSSTALDAFTGTGAGTGVGALAVPLANPPASALTRIYQSSFGSFSLSGDPQALTVDQSTGDVYAVSPSAGTVSRYTSAGAADNFTAGTDSGTKTLTGFSFDGPSAAEVAVAPAGAAGGTAGDIYVASFAGVDIYASDGTHLGQITQANGSGFEETCGVATDNTGNLYIGDFAGKIDRYAPTANPVTNVDYDSQITGVSSPCNIAADSTGAVYASTWSTGPLTKHPAADFGTSNAGTLIDAASRAVSVDPSTDDVYVDEGEKIAVFDSAGTALYTFGSSTDFGTNSAGIAVQGTAGNAYVADPTNKQIDLYGPPAAVPPTATTGSASDIHHVKATLNGHLDPNGGAEITDCHFDWGITNAYGNTAPCTQGNDYTTPADVSTTITGLERGKTYHYRLDISTGASTVTGTDQTFQTVPVPVVHVLTSSFGASGSGDGQFSGNSGLAIDQTSSDMYVADAANHRIEKWDSSGSFISAFGWGVKDGKPEAETCSNGCQAGVAGSGAGQLTTPTFVAVDNSGGPSAGDVYVGDTANNTVTKFDVAGNYISTNDGTASGTAFGPLAGVAVDSSGGLWVYDTNADMREFAQDGSFTTKWNSGLGVTPAGIAVDSSGTLYVVRGNPAVERFSNSGTDLGNVTGYPALPTFNGPTTSLAIDPNTGDLFVDDGGTLIRQYPNPATCVDHGQEGYEGCAIADAFGAGNLNAASGVAVKGSNGRVYVSDPDSVKIFDPATPPEVATGTASALSADSAALSGTVGPNGVGLTDCHFEYVGDAAFLATGFTDLSSGGSVSCSPVTGSIAADFEDHAVTGTITGLDPATIYHFRLVAGNAQTAVNGQSVVIPGPVLVETTGSPTRTTTTARLDSRLDPRGATTSYHFEYGDQGPCDSHPCTSTPTHSAGSGETFEFVSQQLTGLKINTTYHYRVIADNGIPGGVVYGQDATITTRVSDAPLTHGHFPGPPGSDRAWEQVNVPDTDGNPVSGSGTSENGERALYKIDGGSPGSQYGGGLIDISNIQFAERDSTGWHRKDLFPTRAQAPGNLWPALKATSDFSHVYASKVDTTNTGQFETWSMTPGAPAQLLLDVPFAGSGKDLFMTNAEQANRVLSVDMGSLDPSHPVSPTSEELYELTTGTPRMVGLLPDGSVPQCGVHRDYMARFAVTPDGSHAFFGTYPDANCVGQPALFVRDLEGSTTIQIAAHAAFDRFVAGNAFFTTPESLAPVDHGGTDLYRYRLADGSIVCVTCSTVLGGSLGQELFAEEVYKSIAVSDDGSRVYLESANRLLPGAAQDGIYRLDVSTGNVVYVAPGGFDVSVGNGSDSSATSPDGSVFVFLSEKPSLDARNGQQNGGTRQWYRYDDRDRSVVCVSCPGDGSAPLGAAGRAITTNSDIVFSTATPLVTSDENTARPGQDMGVGADIYEWRDGVLLLVTGGEEENSELRLSSVSADDRNVFFTQAARLTPDAPDAQSRFYDARIGGGFDFPPPLPPCSLDACQGNPVAPPFDSTPASSSFDGPGNQHGSSISTTRTKTTTQAKCKRNKKKSKCGKQAKCKKGKKGSKCRKARHANTTRRAGR